MKNWFTVERIDNDTYVISEYRHWEETHCYLLIGNDSCLLIDTGLGICNIHEVTAGITDKIITAVATHVHWDHIGGHKYYERFYAHGAELNWLNGEFPLTIEQIKEMVVDRCELPEKFDINQYEFFQGNPTRLLNDNEVIDIGGRKIQVLHTPGHSPGHMCFWEEERGYLYTGDLVYKDTLFAYYPSTDPIEYHKSLDRLSLLPARKVFPAHHTLNIQPKLIIRMRDAFANLRNNGKLHHGSGVYKFEDWAVWL